MTLQRGLGSQVPQMPETQTTESSDDAGEGELEQLADVAEMELLVRRTLRRSAREAGPPARNRASKR